ncbi:hypothetical protein GWK47_041252 [Chionoecetes opilio]|uniref:Uncharacterized protein n=1 Tax=Chionoecetes opilio TaxID=41210 RepID=A0A8J4YBK5_CHIOP|nr:hypothetical protein GWK47_041252 [Chionoecetes opilio]
MEVGCRPALTRLAPSCSATPDDLPSLSPGGVTVCANRSALNRPHPAKCEELGLKISGAAVPGHDLSRQLTQLSAARPGHRPGLDGLLPVPWGVAEQAACRSQGASLTT